jgi:hypothetical protein
MTSPRTAAALHAALAPALVLADAPGGAAPLADDPTLVALAVALACADAPPDAPAPEPGPEAAPAPELELVATVRAKALRFEEVPQVSVAFTGSGRRRTTWKTERVNLPMRPEAGVTYRDVQVRLTITSGVEELSELLRRARLAARGVRIEAADAPAAPGAGPAPGPASAPGPSPAAAPAAGAR